MSSGLFFVATAILLAVLSLSNLIDYSSFAYVLPAVLNGFFAYRFGVTLLPGREPLITRFRRLERGEVPAPLKVYTRRVTLAWAIFLAVLAVGNIIVGAFFVTDSMQWLVAVLNPAILIGFHFVEHVYRGQRYRHFGPYPIFRTIKVLMQHKAWAAK